MESFRQVSAVRPARFAYGNVAECGTATSEPRCGQCSRWQHRRSRAGAAIAI